MKIFANLKAFFLAMKRIFANNQKLESVFCAGSVPAPKTLLGPNGQPAEWTVTMLTGFFTVVYAMIGRWLNHRKIVAQGQTPDDRVVGSNAFFKNFLWGWFDLGFYIYTKKRGGDGKEVLFVNYKVSRNNLVTRRICDYVRTTEDPNMLIGRFYFKWFGKNRFMGYFTLTRIQPKVAA